VAASDAKTTGDGSPEADRPTRAKTLGTWLTLLGAAGVLAVGVSLLWGVWRPRPIAVAFTRVGGPTRVETAVEASRFWLTAPEHVVTTRANASQEIMWGAARCAMVHDAPLLFTSPDPKRQRLVKATIKGWQKNATPRDPARPEEIKIQNQGEVTKCLRKGDPAHADGLSTLEAAKAPLQLPEVKAQERLAPVVVFAAAKAPTDPPDVAVGLALAAHMATVDREVSLVVVPRYLQADPELEDQLRKRRELVKGGVVLGQTGILSEDARALLRQLLTSTNRQGILGEIRTNLESVEPFVGALLALLALRTSFRKARDLLHQRAESSAPGGRNMVRRRQPTTTSAETAQPTRLAEDQDVTATVWLRSGWIITGTIRRGEDRSDVGTLTLLPLKEARLRRKRDEAGQTGNPVRGPDEGEQRAEFVLVPFEDIELIGVNLQRPVNHSSRSEQPGPLTGI
jgi:hypothetical protein